MTKFKVTLALLTAIIILFMVFIPNIISANIQVVDIVNPAKTSYSQYINCEGEIIDSLRENILIDMPVVPKTLYVSEGDHVKAGQKIMDINREATLNSFEGISTSEVLSVFMSTDIDNLDADLVSKILGRQELPDEILTDYISHEVIPSAIYAKSDGIVTEVNAKPGVMSPALSTMASIAESDEKKACISVSENNISKVQLGQKVVITGLAFPDRVYTGTTTEIATSARKILKGTSVETVVDVIVSLDSYDNLKPGYTTKAKISLTPERKVLTVPYEYVMQDEDQNEYVYLYVGGKAVKQIIKTGVELSAGFEIISGIDEESMIITDPSLVYYDGVYVRLAKED